MPAGNNETLRVLRHSERTTLLHAHLSPCLLESQPEWLQRLTLVLPSRHFVSFAQAIIFRGAGFDAVWREFAAVAGIGLAFFFYSISRFRDSIAVSR
jgi:ABC-type multidrug transport system permease subunit